MGEQRVSAGWRFRHLPEAKVAASEPYISIEPLRRRPRPRAGNAASPTTPCALALSMSGVLTPSSARSVRPGPDRGSARGACDEHGPPVGYGPDFDFAPQLRLSSDTDQMNLKVSPKIRPNRMASSKIVNRTMASCCRLVTQPPALRFARALNEPILSIWLPIQIAVIIEINHSSPRTACQFLGGKSLEIAAHAAANIKLLNSLTRFLHSERLLVGRAKSGKTSEKFKIIDRLARVSACGCPTFALMTLQCRCFAGQNRLMATIKIRTQEYESVELVFFLYYYRSCS
jgi:hypothetical protein